MRKTAAALLSASLAFAAFAAAPPAKVPAEWLTWIDRLGDDDEAVRGAAEKKLSGLGEDVLPALRKAGKTHDDADVRLRASVLASAIEKKAYGEVRVFEGHTEGVIAFALSPDGKRMASAAGNQGADHQPRVWDVSTGKELFRLKGHTAAVYGIDWSSCGKRLLTGGLDGRLIVWDAPTGKQVKELTAHTAVQHVRFTPDGKRAVTCYAGPGGPSVWDLEADKILATSEGSRSGTRGAAVTPDGKRVLSAHFGDGLALLDATTGKPVRRFEAEKHAPWFAAISPDGKLAASCGADGSVRLWELETGKQVRELKGHSDTVHAVAFSPDGARLLTGGYDKTARVWDVNSGTELQRFENHADVVTCAAFLPGGRQAVTSSYDKTLRLWNVRR